MSPPSTDHPPRELLFELIQGLADGRTLSALFTDEACIELEFYKAIDVPTRLCGREAIRAAWAAFSSKHPRIELRQRADILIEVSNEVIAEVQIRAATASDRNERFFVRLGESGGRVNFLRIVRKRRRPKHGRRQLF